MATRSLVARPRLFFITIASVLVVMSAHGQTRQAADANTTTVTFDVSSVKLNKSGGNTSTYGFPPNSDRFRAINAPLLPIVALAYGFNGYTMGSSRVLGAPGWLESDRYDIDAIVASADIAKLHGLTPEQAMLLLKPLLEDRFKLRAHVESRDVAEFALVLTKSGLRLQQAIPGEAYPNLPDGRNGGAGKVFFGKGDWTGQGISLAQLAQRLSPQVGRKVVDQTGLAGKYDIHLTFTPNEGESSDDAVTASIFTALQEQLGLKLEPAKGPVDFLVIDHIERPSEN